MYQIYLTAICLITTGLGMVLAWSWGYKEGLREGHARGRSTRHASLASVVDLHARR